MFGDTFCAGFTHTSISAHMVPHRLHLPGSVGLFLCASVCVCVCVCRGGHHILLFLNCKLKTSCGVGAIWKIKIFYLLLIQR